MSVVAYPQPGKAKSRAALEAFAAGCAGRINDQGLALEPGAAAFFGVVGIEHLFRLACAESRVWFYGDNAYFDCARGKFYRFTRNCLQPHHVGAGDFQRAAALGLVVKPWQRGGEHIVIVEQSPHFLQLSGAHPMWLARVVAELGRYTDRPLRIRRWSRDKAKAAEGLRQDLIGAHALVTHSSAAANEALLAGVPAFVGTKQCVAASLGAGKLSDIENPRKPDGREEWMAWLANSQWTLDELREGVAWRALN